MNIFQNLNRENKIVPMTKGNQHHKRATFGTPPDFCFRKNFFYTVI